MLRTSRETALRAAEIHKGRLAFRQGLEPTACPHLEGSKEREWWVHGHTLEREILNIHASGG